MIFPSSKSKMQYTSNGHVVRNTQPAPELRTKKRIVLIDSRDRDVTKFQRPQLTGGNPRSDPGDYVVYLPRPFENVVSIRLASAEIIAPSSGGFTNPTPYVLLSLEGLNRMDETAPGADRAGYIDTTFAKVPTNLSGSISAGTVLYYNDKISPENITQYSPPISNLSRIHVTWRHHRPGPDWAADTVDYTNPIGAPILFGTSENALMLEIEYLDNGFNAFSTFQTRLENVNYVR